MSKAGSIGLALGLFCKAAMRSLEQKQMDSYAEDEDGDSINKEETVVINEEMPTSSLKKKDIEIIPPASLPRQVLLTSGIVVLGIGAQGAKQYVHPVVQSSLLKAATRFFHNIMRQYSFAKTLPMVFGASGGCVLLGALARDVGANAISESLVFIGQGLPLGELKSWQLDKKIEVEINVFDTQKSLETV